MSKTPTPVPLKPLLLTALAPVLWSTGSAAIKKLGHLPPWTILFWRAFFMAAAIGTWLVFLNARKKKRYTDTYSLLRKMAAGLPVSLLIALSIALYVLSMTKTTAASSLLIQGTAPLFIVLIGRFYLKDPLSRKTLLALAGMMAGLIIIFIPSLSSWRIEGNLYGLAKALAFGLSAVAVRKLKHIDMVPASFTAALLLIPISLAAGTNLSITPSEFAWAAFLGAVSTGIGFMVFLTWSKRIPVTYTGIIVILEAVLGPLWVWLIMGETPAAATFIGGGIILISLIGNSLSS